MKTSSEQDELKGRIHVKSPRSTGHENYQEKNTLVGSCQQKRQNIRYTNDTFDLLSAWLETTATERLQNTHYRNILSGVVVYNCHRHDAWR